ncbi:hypothetical protein GGR56DRAFT_582750 [Xylariaceae sp. FL0804]|nr:hypothetical protein GGR56DRAFT_582750 [Xylariaceae sp. FL0804]
MSDVFRDTQARLYLSWSLVSLFILLSHSSPVSPGCNLHIGIDLLPRRRHGVTEERRRRNGASGQRGRWWTFYVVWDRVSVILTVCLSCLRVYFRARGSRCPGGAQKKVPLSLTACCSLPYPLPFPSAARRIEMMRSHNERKQAFFL